MNRESVQSPNIRSVGYDPQSDVLELEFVSGKVFRYFDVPEFAAGKFFSAPSPEQFLNGNVIYQYRYQRVK